MKAEPNDWPIAHLRYHPLPPAARQHRHRPQLPTGRPHTVAAAGLISAVGLGASLAARTIPILRAQIALSPLLSRVRCLRKLREEVS